MKSDCRYATVSACLAFMLSLATPVTAAPFETSYLFHGGAYAWSTSSHDGGGSSESASSSFAPEMISGILTEGGHWVLDGYAQAPTSFANAYSSNTSTFTLNTDGSGSFSSAMSHFASGMWFRPGIGGGSSDVYVGSGARLSFALSERATFKFLTGVEKTGDYVDPAVAFAGQPVPNTTGVSAPFAVQVPAGVYSLIIDGPWTSMGGVIDPRSGFAQFGVRWGIDELPGTAPSHPIAMDSFDAANASPSQLGYLSSVPEDIGRVCATTTVISDGSDSMLYFHTSIFDDVGVSARTASGGQAFVFGSGGANITSATIPAEFGSASQFLVEFDGIQRHASLGQTFSFLGDAPGGISSFRLVPLDGVANDDFVIGLQFTQAQLATVFAGHAVPEPATWGLALCAALCLMPVVRRHGRK